MQIVENFPLKNLTTLQIGGPASKFVSINSVDELKEAIQYAKENNLEYLIIGGGSNLLVSDKGVDKLVIKNNIIGIYQDSNVIPAKAGIYKDKKWIPNQVWDDKVTLSVKSGTVLQDLVNYCIEHGLSGLENLTGIPGTVGGAVYGNAGAYGQTISDNILSVVILNPSVIPAKAGIYLSEGKTSSTYKDGSRINAQRAGVQYGMTKEECEFNYRDSIFKRNKLPILEVTFQLEKGDPSTLQKEANEVLENRLVKYPKGIKCPGSFFKNIVASTLPKEILDKIPPEKIVYGKLPAGSLLEMVGAKGDLLDGIYIADYHANLFINKGDGSAEAFYNLAKKYAEKVYLKFGIKLEPEVQLINLPSLI